MLQDKHTNYSYIKLAVYVDITEILYENQNYNKNKSKSKKKISSRIKIPVTGLVCAVSDHPPHLSAEELE